MNLEKIKKELKNIEEKIEGSSFEGLRILENELQKKFKYLLGTKKYLKKQKNADLAEINDLIHYYKRIRNRIRQEKTKNQNGLLIESKGKQKEPIIMESEEVLAIEKIKNSDDNPEEKRNKFESFLLVLQAKIDYFFEENRRLLNEKKYNLEIVKDYQTYHQKEKQIKENRIKIKQLKNAMQIVKTCLIQSDRTKRKASSNIEKEKFLKNERENGYYYLILKELLNEDKNYFLLKKMIERNANFLNARLNGKHILFDIVYKYIENATIERFNQSLIHINPNYFSALIELFLANDLLLTYQERTTLLFLLSYITQNVKEETDLQPLILNNNNTISLRTESEKKRIVNLMKDISRNSSRVNLTKKYLENINAQIVKLQKEYFKKQEITPNEQFIKEELHCPSYDITNSRYIGDTFTFKNSKYAINLGFDSDFNQYVRIHILDTSFIPEYSDIYNTLYQNMFTKKNKFKSKWSFQNLVGDEELPSFTYQFKICKNGEVTSFKMYESVIQVDRSIENSQLLNYREDEELKSLLGTLRLLANDYQLEMSEYNVSSIEGVINSILNIELKAFIEKNNLPALYFVKQKYNEEEREELNQSLCYYFSKIPKKEAIAVLNSIKETCISRFYTTVSVEDGQLQLDSREFVGYKQLLILKSYVKNALLPEKKVSYEKDFQQIETLLNQENAFINYENQKKLNREKKKI